MGPSLRTWELAAWCRSRRIDAADETMLRVVFEERDNLRHALEDLLTDVDAAAVWTGARPESARTAQTRLEETAP